MNFRTVHWLSLLILYSIILLHGPADKTARKVWLLSANHKFILWPVDQWECSIFEALNLWALRSKFPYNVIVFECRPIGLLVFSYPSNYETALGTHILKNNTYKISVRPFDWIESVWIELFFFKFWLYLKQHK